MARPREFEPQEALHRAVHLFWQRGYEQITMADPVAATGVSRYGFIPNLGTNMTCF